MGAPIKTLPSQKPRFGSYCWGYVVQFYYRTMSFPRGEFLMRQFVRPGVAKKVNLWQEFGPSEN